LAFFHHFIMSVSLTNTVMILFQSAVPATPATPEPEAPAPPVVDPTGTAPVSQGQTRPMVLPSSAWRASDHAPATAALVLLLAAGAALV
jgi:hypothetical protein